MINLIILIAIIITGLILPKDKYYGDRSFLSICLLMIGSVLLASHLVAISLVSIEYNAFKASHEQLKVDLENSRKLNASYEKAAILKEIIHHNQIIVSNQVLNKNWFIDQYIDDRVDELKPIK